MNTKPSGKDRGYCYERTKHNPLEKALADHWEKENIPSPYLNAGQGTLQNLFVDYKDPALSISPRCASFVHEVTDDERMVVATVIQWLGSNCGQAFLIEALEKAGYTIVKRSRQ